MLYLMNTADVICFCNSPTITFFCRIVGSSFMFMLVYATVLLEGCV